MAKKDQDLNHILVGGEKDLEGNGLTYCGLVKRPKGFVDMSIDSCSVCMSGLLSDSRKVVELHNIATSTLSIITAAANKGLEAHKERSAE